MLGKPMSNRIFHMAAGAALVLLVLAGAAFCSTKPFEGVGYYVSNATTFPRGVRNIGMGGVGAADISGFSTGYFNAASFAWSDAVTLGASTSGWMDLIDYTDARLSAGYPLKGTLLGAGLRLGGSFAYARRSIDLDDFDCGRTIYVPEGTGVCRDYHDHYLSGSLAARAKKGVWELGLGGTAKYLEATGFGSYTTWAFDLGLIAAADIERADGFGVRPRAGASIRNLGEDIDETRGIEQPGERRCGFGIDIFTQPLAAVTEKLHRRVPAYSLSFDYDIVRGAGSNPYDGWAFGTEMSFFKMVSLRAGWSDGVFFSGECSTYGVGLGWDFGLALFQLDYARMDPTCDSCSFLGVDPEEDAFGLVIGGRF